MSRERAGVALCAVSAVSYSSAAVFAKYAYGDGVGVTTLLAVRYVAAAAFFWALIVASGMAPPPRALAGRAFALGMILYAGQAGFFFSAISVMDVSLTSLICYVYPAMVAGGSILLGRERWDGRRAVALGLALGGVVLVLTGSQGGSLNAAGVLLALGSAVSYTAYLLLGQSLMVRVEPMTLSGLVCGGAATAYVAVGLATGGLAFDFGATGWASVGALVAFSTMIAVSASFAGIARVGPTVNSIIMTVEVPLAVVYGTLLFGERLSAVQAAGGALVLSAILLLQARPKAIVDMVRRRRATRVPV